MDTTTLAIPVGDFLSRAEDCELYCEQVRLLTLALIADRRFEPAIIQKWVENAMNLLTAAIGEMLRGSRLELDRIMGALKFVDALKDYVRNMRLGLTEGEIAAFKNMCVNESTEDSETVIALITCIESAP
jgi:hypothetical protein